MTDGISTPLNGVRVLDLGRFQAGPRCALMFARMGADVIKVEGINGDESRTHGPMVRGQSAYWVQYNSGKRSLSLNLRTTEGKDVLMDLVCVADIFIQNFRPGTIEDMGFGYESLSKLNPKIVMVNVSAYGQYGPYRNRIGFDPIGQALGGLMSVTGFPEGPPMKSFFPIIDRITALHATIGAMAALREREISGKGQSIDVSLADSGFTVNEIPIAAYLGNGQIQQREGNGRGPMNTYKTSDGWALLAANNDSTWQRLCRALGRDDWLEDPRFATRENRLENAADLEPELKNWFASRKTKDTVTHLTANGVPIAPVNSVEQAATDPHLSEREMMVEVSDPTAGRIHVTGKVIKFGRTPMTVGPAAIVGEHTIHILSDLLGYSPARIRRLQEKGVVRCAESATMNGQEQ